MLAAETRGLAEKTRSASSEIGEIAKSLQLISRDAVEALQATGANVKLGMTIAEQVRDSMLEIQAGAKSVSKLSQPSRWEWRNNGSWRKASVKNWWM